MKDAVASFSSQTLMDIVFKEVWRRNDPQQAAEARTFWEGLLSPEERERRVTELCCMAYDGDRLVGLSTALPAELPEVNACLAMYRCAVAPGARRRDIAKQITGRSIAILQAWSAAHPEEKVLGVGAVIQAEELLGMGLRPLWPDAGNLNLAFYLPGGRQLRIAWFSHARLRPG